jgi:hypothetical protein
VWGCVSWAGGSGGRARAEPAARPCEKTRKKRSAANIQAEAKEKLSFFTVTNPQDLQSAKDTSWGGMMKSVTLQLQ